MNLSQGSGPASCEAGVQGGVCGCLDLDLLSDPPNIFFVLDRSGSMADDDKWNTIRGVISDLIVDLGPRAKFGTAIFPAVSPTGDVCATGAQVMPLRQGDSPAGTRGETAALFIESTDVPASGGTPTAATIAGLTSILAALPGKTVVILATDGGPNCDFNAKCSASDCTINIEGASCPSDGGVSCCVDDPEDCLDTGPSVNALAALKSAGVPTYVVGVPGSEPYAEVLDAMALAGGTSRLDDSSGDAAVGAADESSDDASVNAADDASGDASAGTGYYQVTTADQSAFLATLSTVAAKVTATCTLALSAPPPDPSLVNVYLDGTVVPADPTNGWTLDGATITLEGTTCQEVLSGSALSLRIVAGCPTVIK